MAELEGHVAENYRQLVEDPNRPETYASIASYAADHASPTLAAWAREQALAAGEDITPFDATHGGGAITREYGGLRVAELREVLAERGVDHSGLKTKAELVASLEAGDVEADAAVPVVVDEYAELTDDEVRQLAADSSLETDGTREELIARLDKAQE